MNPNEGDIGAAILARFDRVEEKIEDLRRDLTEQFVLKQVFELWSDHIVNRINDIDTLNRNRIRDSISVGGGVLGVLAILNSWFHFIR